MANANQRVGKFGEWLAAEHLVDSGMRLVARNWRCPLGEIDIIAQDGDTVVFCEVKTRRGTRYGTPAAAVVQAKRAAAQAGRASGSGPPGTTRTRSGSTWCRYCPGGAARHGSST